MLLETKHSPLVSSKEHGITFSADFQFSYALILPKHNLVALFIDGWSGKLDFVGKVYLYNGELYDIIDFPPNGTGDRQNAFWYASESEEGVRIFYHQQNERDFGGNYDFTTKKYGSFHEAR